MQCSLHSKPFCCLLVTNHQQHVLPVARFQACLGHPVEVLLSLLLGASYGLGPHCLCRTGPRYPQLAAEGSYTLDRNLTWLSWSLVRARLRGQTQGDNRVQTQIFIDFCRFLPFPKKQSIWRTQIFAESCKLSQETGENRGLRFVPLGLSPHARPYLGSSGFAFWGRDHVDPSGPKSQKELEMPFGQGGHKRPKRIRKRFKTDYFKYLVSRGRCDREIAWRLAAVVAASFPRFWG